jgi:hydrogenase expression/formation protein HypD
VKHIGEYRDKGLIMKLAGLIRKNTDGRRYSFMEVCGGHTTAILRFGIPSLLPENLKLISGPGCPVCVTNNSFIDKAIGYSRRKDVIITTFGDLIRVPGSGSSLEKEKARGGDIRIVFSALEALDIAKSNCDKKVIFLGIGFETTAPGTAVTIKEADKAGIENFYLLSAHKVMPPAMEVIIKEGAALDGFICPGHVAAIIGSSAFGFIPLKYRIGCVMTGFEPVDILQAIYMLVNQVNNDSPCTEIQYTRVVTREGNIIAQRHMNDIFILSDDQWRGFGTVASSGLAIRKAYERFDAEKVMPVNIKNQKENVLCICGDILRGLKTPSDCKLFAGTCIPENPVGACMVSGEGACNTFYKYRLNE